MTYENSPEGRRVLIAYTQADWDALAPSKRREISGKPGVGALIIDGESDLEPEVVQRVRAENTLTSEALFVQNPYDVSKYFAEEDAALEIALEKTLCVAQVCHVLGSRSFAVNSIQNETDGTTWDANAGGGAKGVVAKFKGGGGKSRRLARKIKLSDESTGGNADINAARAFLAAHNLESDSMLRALVDLVEVEGNNIQKRSLTVDVSREAKGTLKLAMDVKASDFGAGDAGGGRTRESIDELTVTYDIAF